MKPNSSRSPPDQPMSKASHTPELTLSRARFSMHGFKPDGTEEFPAIPRPHAPEWRTCRQTLLAHDWVVYAEPPPRWAGPGAGRLGALHASGRHFERTSGRGFQQGIAVAIHGAFLHGHLFWAAAAPLKGSLPMAVVAQPGAVLLPESAVRARRE